MDSRLTLTFKGVNYAAEVWLNGKKLGGFTGAFLRGKFDVTGLASAGGENALAVRVTPPPHPGIPQRAVDQRRARRKRRNGSAGRTDIFRCRRMGLDSRNSRPQHGHLAGCDADGDRAGRRSATCNVITTLPKPDRSEADIEIEAPLTNTGSAAIDGELTASFDDVKVTKHVHLAPGETVVRLEPAEFAQLKVQNPRLWWPNGYGDPALHTLTSVSPPAAKTSASETN